MLIRTTANLEEFANGKTVYFTRGFCTYTVRYIEQLGSSRVIIEIIEPVLVHRKDTKDATAEQVLKSGSRVMIDPRRLWVVEHKKRSTRQEEVGSSLWSRVKNFLNVS